jgi:phosphatidylserine/phosphatidylglycerophosphate/cardiolipin synthase-like enzyme
MILGETTSSLHKSFPRGELWLASSYLSLPKRFESAIMAHAKSHSAFPTHLLSSSPQVRMLADVCIWCVASTHFRVFLVFVHAVWLMGAAPHLDQANGWYGAKGISGNVPALYAAVTHRFLQRLDHVLTHPARALITVYEYFRTGWSYHAKGMWMESRTLVNPVTSPRPLLTAVGSPNYSSRSLNSDMETQLIVVTQSPSLQAAIRAERDAIVAASRPVTLTTFDGPNASTDHRRARHPIVRMVVRFFRQLL